MTKKFAVALLALVGIVLTPSSIASFKVGGFVFPTTDGSPGQFMKTDGAGNLGFGTVTTSFTATAPLAYSLGNYSIAKSNGSTDGYLSATDWATFNAKQNALSFGNATSTTTGVSISGGTGAVIGSGLALNIQNATTSQPGLLTSSDWNTFNGKQAAGNYLTALTGDVTASGPGSATATVVAVGTSTAANVHAAEVASNAATNLNTASTIVKRDGSGNFSAGTITASLAGNASTVTTNANLTGPITSTGNATSVASQTGTGSTFVMNTSPTLVTPNLGTPTALVGTNITGTASGLTAGNVTTNANLTGTIISVGNATSVASQTGTGSKFVMDTSPTLVTPNIGAATGTSLSASGTVSGSNLTSGGHGSLDLAIASNLSDVASKTTAFNNLSPNTTKGDISVHNGTNNVRFPVGSDGQIPIADSSQASGLRWGTQTASSGINYFSSNPDAETNATGYTAYGNTPGVAPVTATGGTPVTQIGRTTVSPIRGVGSFLITKDAVNRQGEGVSFPFTMDSGDAGNNLTLTFDYQVASGTYASNDIAVYIYDVTNGALLGNPQNYQLAAPASGGQGHASMTFQMPTNSTSFRVAWHVSSISAAAYTFKFDNVSLSPFRSVQGMPGTEWAPYTPTFTGFGSVTSSIQSRRVGDTLQIRGNFTVGTTTGVEAQMTLGYNGTSGNVVSSDSSKLPSISMCGTFTLSITAGVSPTVLCEQSKGYITFGYQDGTRAGTTKQLGSSVTGSAGSSISLYASIPIQGWSSGVTMSDSIRNAPTSQVLTGSGTYVTPPGVKYLIVHAVGAGGGGGSSGTSGTATGGTGGNTTFGTSLLTATGGLGGVGGAGGNLGGVGGTATITTPAISILPSSGGAGQGSANANAVTGGAGCSSLGGGGAGGAYSAAGLAGAAGTGSGGGGGGGWSGGGGAGGGGCGAQLWARIENPSASYSYATGTGGASKTAGTSGFASGAGADGSLIVEEYYLNAGAVADLGPVKARYYNNSGQSLTNGATATITNWTKDYDNWSAMNASTGVYTVPIAGMYHIDAKAGIDGSANADIDSVLYLKQNGTMVSTGRTGAKMGTIGTVAQDTLTDDIYCNAGDLIRLDIYESSGGGRTMPGGNQTTFGIYRVSN